MTECLKEAPIESILDSSRPLFQTPLYHLGRLFPTRLYHLGRLFPTRLYHLHPCRRTSL